MAELPGICNYKKHVFICTGEKCAAPEVSQALWQELKKRTGETGLFDPLTKSPVRRSQSSCLGVCHSGPILAVYPEGVWYRQVDKEGLERILTEHLQQGEIVKDYLLHQDPGFCAPPI